MPVAAVESLDREGRGVAHVEGKAVFIEGALPGERVEYRVGTSKRSYDLGILTRILRESAARVAPRCPYFGTCGGCAMQHLEPRAQVATKQRVLEDALWHIGKVRPDAMLAPIHGPPWGYRRRARLSVRFVERKGGALVGFRERKSTFVADIGGCDVLPPSVAALLLPLRELIGGLSIRDRVPQVEVAVGEAATVLILRVLEPPVPADEAALRQFADTRGVQVWLQPGGPDSARPLHPTEPVPLYYSLPEFGIRIEFLPTDFTQVNYDVNAVLVRRAMRLLAPRPGERVLDLFCGLGNFALPIAHSGAAVTGIDLSGGLIERARDNARRNGLAAEFAVANLFDPAACARLPGWDALLLDPPREGAIEVIKALEGREPGRILYVSCDPATLARDAGVLVHRQGYRLAAAGVVNMFPHTGHVESIALFEPA
jgi:23S rRNA (uracil1939-C5)-methyltransferase